VHSTGRGIRSTVGRTIGATRPASAVAGRGPSTDLPWRRPTDPRMAGRSAMISQAIVDPLEDLPWLEPDAADQLEVARLRFLGLTALLSPLSWHTRVAASLELLREVRIALPQVDARMDRLCQRIALEPDVPGVA